MSNKKYDTLVLIGRFQPFHNAHFEIIKRAAALTDQLVIIVGSANQPRTYKNPWTSKEREMMLNNVLDQLYDNGDFDNTVSVRIEHNIDTIYNDAAWMCRVQEIVSKYAVQGGGKTGVIGHNKDDSTFYLNMFPQWEVEEVELIEPLNATNVRDLYFRNDCNLNFIRSVVPQPVFRMLEGWKGTPDFNQVVKEREFIATYKKQWSTTPYPVIFNTVDACVVQSGHVLLIERRSEPGRGTLALAGGFLNPMETIEEAMLRELREETRLKVPKPVLKGCITKRKVFDAPNRSARGRTITHAFLITLPSGGSLPAVKGGDDAKSAMWVPLHELRSDNMFEDHFDIINDLLGVGP